MLKIFTTTFNRPDFIDLQLRSFKKYLLEDFEFTIFNDAPLNQRQKIKQICAELGIRELDTPINEDKLVADARRNEVEPTFRVDIENRSPSVCDSYALSYAWKRIILEELGPTCFLEADVFLMDFIKLSDVLQQYQLCYIPQCNQNSPLYIWPVFVLVDLFSLPEKETLNWWCGNVKGAPTDTGGHTALYLEAHPELRIRHLTGLGLHGEDMLYAVHNIDIEGKPTLLHYYAGSGWQNRSLKFHEEKAAWLRQRLGL